MQSNDDQQQDAVSHSPGRTSGWIDNKAVSEQLFEAYYGTNKVILVHALKTFLQPAKSTMLPYKCVGDIKSIPTAREAIEAGDPRFDAVTETR